MATPEDVLDGVAAAMESGVPDLTTVLHREADPVDNEVEFPHGEISVVSNIRSDPWNTDFVGYAYDDQGNRIGYILEGKFDVELDLRIWLAVPSDNWNIQSLGTTLENAVYKYDENRQEPAPLPDGSGGNLTDVEWFRVNEGGELPTESGNNPPLRGYAVNVDLRFTNRIDTSEEYGAKAYVESVDIPESGDLTDGDDSDAVAIEYNAT